MMLMFAMFSSFSFAQNEDVSEKPGMMNVLEPEFKGINETASIKDFLQESLAFQEEFINKAGIEGSVFIQFKVLPNGNLSEYLVINSVCPKYDEAVIRALETANGAWTPGTNNGHPVTMEKEVTVIFKFDGIEMYKTAQLYANKADKLSKEGKYNRAIKLYNKAIVSKRLSQVLHWRPKGSF